MSDDVGQRVQMMIELGDLFFVLPGSDGTLQELFQVSENLAHNPQYIYQNKYWKKRMFVNDEYLEALTSLQALNNKITKRIDNWSRLSDFMGSEIHELLKPVDFQPAGESVYQFNSTGIKDLLEELQQCLNLTIFPKKGLWKKEKKEQQCVISIDVAQIEKNINASKTDLGGYYTYCSEEYSVALVEFLAKNNSIMLDPAILQNSKISRWTTIVNLNKQTSFSHDLDFHKGHFKEEGKRQASFDDWCSHLEEKMLGRTAFWKSYEVTLHKGSSLNLSVFILFDVTLPRALRNKLEIVIDDAVLAVSFSTIKGKFDNTNENLIKASTRAAVSQVMARNMSHNIGSHVLSRLDKEVIKNIFDGKFQPLYYTPLEMPTNKAQKGLELFANSISYQKSRMDFLADVTFGEPTLETTKSFFSEILSGIDKNYILMDYISGTNYKYKLVARNLTYDKAKDECFGKPCSDISNYIIAEGTSNDVSVSVPNDVLGCHAFYLILENLIRNCAKHGGGTPPRGGINKIHLDIANFDDDHYELLIYDSGEKEFEGKDVELVKELNTRINDDILDYLGKLRQGGWGLVEMETGAAYLRKIPIEKANDDEFSIDITDETNCYPSDKTKANAFPNLLKAVKVGDKHLGYRMFLMKPKEALIIFSKKEYDETSKSGLESKKDEWVKSGIVVKVIDESNESKFTNDTAYAYPIMLFVGSTEDYDKHIVCNTNKLPSRKLICLESEQGPIHNSRFIHSLTTDDVRIILDKEEPCQLLNTIWSLWLNSVLEYTNVSFTDRIIDPDRNSNTKTNIIRFIDEPLKSKFRNEGGLGFKLKDHAVKEAKDLILNTDDATVYNAFAYIEPYNSKDNFIVKKVQRNDNLEKNFGDIIEAKDFPLWIKFLESAVTTVFVIDERIQELSENTTYTDQEDNESLQYIDLLYATNVMVPRYPAGNNSKSKSIRFIGSDSRFDLNQSEFSGEYESILNYMQSIIKKTDDRRFDKTKADFLLIHLGILEKMIKIHAERSSEKKYNKDEPEGVEKFILEEILQIDGDDTEVLRDIQTKLIIVSGRGKPSNLPKGILYLNYSIVAQYCIENRLKVLLNDVVHSSKPL